jgi:hypothetical protein
MEAQPAAEIIPPEIVASWGRLLDPLSELVAPAGLALARFERAELRTLLCTAEVAVWCPTGARVVLDDDWNAAPRLGSLIAGTGESAMAYLGLPVLWPDGGVFGVALAAAGGAPRWGARHERALHAVGSVVEADLDLIASLDSARRRCEELEAVLRRTRILRGLLPMCASCKRIRNEAGYWEGLEDYLERHSEAAFSHGVCPDCERRLYPELEL